MEKTYTLTNFIVFKLHAGERWGEESKYLKEEEESLNDEKVESSQYIDNCHPHSKVMKFPFDTRIQALLISIICTKFQISVKILCFPG